MVVKGLTSEVLPVMEEALTETFTFKAMAPPLPLLLRLLVGPIEGLLLFMGDTPHGWIRIFPQGDHFEDYLITRRQNYSEECLPSGSNG